MSEQRKKDHINLTFKSQTKEALNHGLVYEPMLSSMTETVDLSVAMAGKTLQAPLWISSMTGGTGVAKEINANLAYAAGKASIGMGLGSCRCLLDSDERLEDFQVRKHMGDGGVLFANLGIAQLEILAAQGKLGKVAELVDKLEADGLIAHVNPLQEYMQPEGDRIQAAPIDTIKRLLDAFDGRVIVKEVGQGMGPESLRQLRQLPLEAVEFAAFGGTNFTKLEQTRHKSAKSGTRSELSGFAHIGHTAAEMIDWINQMESRGEGRCPLYIISGGVDSALSGHALQQRLRAPSLIGMAQAYLRRAMIGPDETLEFVEEQIEALRLARLYLKRNAFEND